MDVSTIAKDLMLVREGEEEVEAVGQKPVQIGYFAASVRSLIPLSGFQHPRLGMLPTTQTRSPAS